MAQHLYILTGASRGMGLALANQLLHRGATLLTISRNPAHMLHAQAVAHNAGLYQWSYDLSVPQGAADQLLQWLPQQWQRQPPLSATLINNAAIIPTIAPLSASDWSQIGSALRVGLQAPMLLTSAFLQATQDWCIPKKVLNISSGLGRRAMASQATYCAIKAGLDNFSSSVALEESLKPHGARICALAPGVIDTDMQVQLRSACIASFPDAQRFADLQAQGLLTSAQDAATQVLAWLDRMDFGSQVIADVRSP